LPFLKSLSARLGGVLALYGGWGLFAISFLDSSFLTFPFVNDLLLIHLSSQSPRKAAVYALLTTAGSVLGAGVIYGLARAGGNWLWQNRSPEKMGRVRSWLSRNDFLAVLIASLLPPPVPMKPVVIGAGVLRMNTLRFGIALVTGRALRFAADAWMGARYGARAESYLKDNFSWASIAVASLILSAALVFRWAMRRGARAPGGPAGPGCS